VAGAPATGRRPSKHPARVRRPLEAGARLPTAVRSTLWADHAGNGVRLRKSHQDSKTSFTFFRKAPRRSGANCSDRSTSTPAVYGGVICDQKILARRETWRASFRWGRVPTIDERGFPGDQLPRGQVARRLSRERSCPKAIRGLLSRGRCRGSAGGCLSCLASRERSRESPEALS
jgi:hypothetical protein